MSHASTSAVERAPGSRWDWPLIVAWAGLTAMGLLMILSASSLDADSVYGNSLHYVFRQMSGVALGVLVGSVLMVTPWRWLRKASVPVFLLALVLCLLVISPLGRSVNGAQRWISLGFINLQPSELLKIGLVLALSDYLARNEGRMRDIVGVVVPGLAFLTFSVLAILPQKDFGTTVLLLGATAVCFFVAGVQWRYLVVGGGVGGSLLALLVAIEPYRLRRLIGFTDPFSDADGAGYQVVQGWIALATGGLTGSGLAGGVAQRGFLPEAHTDFIAAVIGEEFGAVGWAIMVCLQLVLVWRGLEIASRAADLWGTLVASGMTALLAAQCIINLGVIGALFPNKGLVLPFLSYGASAVLAHTVVVGVLLRVGHEQGPVLPPAPAPAPGLAGRVRGVAPHLSA